MPLNKDNHLVSLSNIDKLFNISHHDFIILLKDENEETIVIPYHTEW